MNDKTKLTELGSDPSHEKATPGNFRACVMLDSCIYQIGEDVPAREDAFILCSEYRGMDAPIQIFDDQGKTHIINGLLKTNKDNGFFHEKKSCQTFERSIGGFQTDLLMYLSGVPDISGRFF